MERHSSSQWKVFLPSESSIPSLGQSSIRPEGNAGIRTPHGSSEFLWLSSIRSFLSQSGGIGLPCGEPFPQHLVVEVSIHPSTIQQKQQQRKPRAEQGYSIVDGLTPEAYRYPQPMDHSLQQRVLNHPLLRQAVVRVNQESCFRSSSCCWSVSWSQLLLYKTSIPHSSKRYGHLSRLHTPLDRSIRA